MRTWKISVENIKSKPLYTLLSVLVLSLSIALLLGVQQLKTSFTYQIENNLGNIDLVLGAKGSPLQLVLSSVLHVDNPTGNISYNEAKKIANSPLIDKAIPISYGDNYKGFRIVGTQPDFLTFYKAKISKGSMFKSNLEVIIGNDIAEKLNLKLGDTFLSSHGLIENESHVHDDVFKVVGILEPTQKVIDRLILSNLESVWAVHGHHGNENSKNTSNPIDNNREITSLLISFRNPTALLTLPRRINKDTNMQAALPKYELNKLYEYTGVGLKTISGIAYIILLISGLTIFISLYKMIKERAFDLALLRTYGASNFNLIKIVTLEGFIIVFSGIVLGYLLSQFSISTLLSVINSNNKLAIQPLPVNELIETLSIVIGAVVLSISFAIYPIIKMNISTILSNEK